MASIAQRDKRRMGRGFDAPESITFEPVVVHLQAAAGDSLPTFEAVAYSGGKLYVKGYPLPVVVDLSGLEVNANATILLDHDSQKRVGHPSQITKQGSTLRVSGVISAETDSAREVVASAKNKYRWQMSIGARVQTAYEVPAGKQVTVNGKVHTGPIIVASQSKLNEISFVGAGADEDNVVRIAAAATAGVTKMTVKTSSPIGERIQKAIDAAGLDVVAAAARLGVSEDDLQEVLDGTEDQPSGKLLKAAAKEFAIDLADLKPAKPKTPATKPDPGDEDPAAKAVKDIRAAASAETQRIADIRKAFDGDFPEIEAKAVSEGWDVVKAELELMRAEREVAKKLEANSPRGGSGIHGARGLKGGDSDVTGRAIEAALCLDLCGMKEEAVGKQYDEKVMNLAVSKPFRGLTLHALMDRTLQAVGKSLGHGAIDGDTIVEFFEAEKQLKASAPGSFSTLATSGILSNVANKTLLDSFLAVKTTIPTLFGRRSVKDFKQNTAYRLAMNGELLEVPAGGEIKHADLEETSFTFQAKTWGRMLTLTRRDIINDDLSAFQQIPQLLGRKSALAVEKQGWKLVLSNPSTFFGSGNANNQSGAATALSIDSLSTGEKLLLDQIDSAGDPILVNARYLVTGTALAVTAADLMKENRILMESATTSTSKRIPGNNPHAGKWTPIFSPFVNAQGLTGSSATVWYLFADPADVAAFVISYLNGRDTPMIESSDLDFNHLGMSWRVVFDFGVDAQDPRGAVRSVGA